MNKVCPEQFINMHKQPLLEDLSQHLTSVLTAAAQDPNLLVEMKKMNLQSLCDLLASVPKRGSFDLDNVRQSTYFFS
ncbi:hypothetical protein BsWGS_29225 [Bradybaena similaris]